MLNYNISVHLTDSEPKMLSQEDRAFINAVMVRDSVRKLPELRAIAIRKFPKLPLSKLSIQIDYGVVPPTFDVFHVPDSIMLSDDIMTNNRTKLSDDDAKKDSKPE